MLKLKLHWQILIAMIIGIGIGLILQSQNTQLNIVTKTKAETLANQFVNILDSLSTNKDNIIISPLPSGLLDSTDISLAVELNADLIINQNDVDTNIISFAKSKSLPIITAFNEKELISQIRDLQKSQRVDTWVYSLIVSLGTIFIRLLKMVIVPLIFTSIVSGVSGIGGG